MAFNVFAFLWQVQRLGFVAQMATLPLRDDNGVSRLPFQVLTLPLLYCLLRPHCLQSFYFSGILSASAMLWRYISDGLNSALSYLLFVEVLFLVRCVPTILRMMRKNDQANQTTENWHHLMLKDISKCCRDSATLLYFLSGLHKMNFDYFVPAKGCAFTMIAGNLGLYTPSLLKYAHHFGWAATISSVVLEFGHPLITMYAQWNKFEVLLLTAFHLGINTPAPYGAPTFTYLMIHVLCVCNLDLYDEMCAILRSIWALVALIVKRYVSSFTLCLSVVIISLGMANLPLETLCLGNEEIEVAVMIYNVIGAVLLVMSAYRQITGRSYIRMEQSEQDCQIQTSPTSTIRHGLHVRLMYIMILLLMLLHGLQPYFGLSTIGVFSMYSNLQPYATTSNGETNKHFFMPRKQSQLQGHHVKVLESTSSTFLCAAIQQDRPEIRSLLHDIGINSTIVYTPLMYFHRIAIGNTFEDCHDYERDVDLVFRPYMMTKTQFARLALAKRNEDSPSYVKYQDMQTNDINILHLPMKERESYPVFDENTWTESLLYTVPFYEEDPSLCYTA